MSNINCTSQVLFVKENIKTRSTKPNTMTNNKIKIISNRACVKTISEQLTNHNNMILRHL